MDAESVKGKPLTKEETKNLLDLVESSTIITIKNKNATNNKLKKKEWRRLTQIFNKTTNSPRTPQQLRLKWENLKKNARKRNRIRNQLKIEGDYTIDDILERVSEILSLSGSSAPLENDKDGFVATDSDCDDGHDTKDVNQEKIAILPTILSTDNDIDVVDVKDQNETPIENTKINSFNRRAGKRKFIDCRKKRDSAIANYYILKRKSVYLNNTTIHLKNENLRLQNSQLSLNNEKLSLEIQKLKMELEQLKEKLT